MKGNGSDYIATFVAVQLDEVSAKVHGHPFAVAFEKTDPKTKKAYGRKFGWYADSKEGAEYLSKYLAQAWDSMPADQSFRLKLDSFWKVEITASMCSEIHPADMATALCARIRGGKNPKAATESVFLDSLAGTGEWTADQILQIKKSSADKGFKGRFADAINKGRKPTFSERQLFILRSWREITLWGETFDGLRSWAPLAAVNFMEWFFKNDPPSQEGYDSARKRLGLGKEKHTVIDFEWRVSSRNSGELNGAVVTLATGPKKKVKAVR